MDIRSIGEPEDEIRSRFSPEKLSVRANQAAEARALRIANRFVEILKSHIELQDLNWDPLSSDYAAFKRATGLDPRIWIATGLLLEQIEVTPSKETTSHGGTEIRKGFFAGITRDKMHDDVPTWLIADALEHGVAERGLPARPLFGPSEKELVNEEKEYDRTHGEGR